jgi:hypothetical protein
VNDAGLERALDDLPDGGGPREGWQDCVLARIEVPPARPRPRWPLVAAGSGLVAAAAAVVLFVALRTGERPAPPADNRVRLEQLMRDIDETIVEAERLRLLRAATAAEKAQAQAELDRARAKRDEMGRRLETLKARKRKRAKEHEAKVVAKCEPNDPLCAIE